MFGGGHPPSVALVQHLEKLGVTRTYGGDADQTTNPNKMSDLSSSGHLSEYRKDKILPESRRAGSFRSRPLSDLLRGGDLRAEYRDLLEFVVEVGTEPILTRR